MFIDEVVITVKGGDGGDGIVSFGKMAKSGPDGGNGGRGGDVYAVASSDLSLLSKYVAKNKISAQDGIPGRKDKMVGRDGEDYDLLVPVGSSITDLDSGEKFDLDSLNTKIRLCDGGEGGLGNFEMRSSTNTTPLNTTSPKSGQKRRIKIVLSFIADFGLIGLPSSGKSSLLNELTGAKVRTAEYHFTTLSPNLGVLPGKSGRLAKKIIADIPGLIEGASEGKGLGVKFLKHIQKVGLLLHCISSNSQDAMRDYEVIRKELGAYDKTLLKKKELIILTKSDLVTKGELVLKRKALKIAKGKIIDTSIHDTESIEKLLIEMR